MQKFINVDVEYFLEQVMKSNTNHYQSDFDIDKKIFDAALKSKQSRDKYLLWLSRGNGTHCLKETEVLIKFTSAYNTWMHWAEPKRDDEKFVAFAIHITGENNGKPIADLYELDYNTHVELIKQNAVEAVEKIIHFQNGDIHLDLSAPTTIPTDINYGEYVSTEYIPKDSILFEERIRQMRNSYENLPEGKIEEYLSSIGDEPFRFVIWSDLNLDYEEGIEFAKENYPDEPEDKLIQRYIEENQEMLETERINLDIQYNQPIIIIGDLGLWNGRAHGYKDVASGNIKDCLYSDTDMTEWFLDEKGDLRAEAAHHDGTNYYLYRVFKDNVTEDQIEDFKDKIYDGVLTETDIEKYTRRLGDDIAKVYGIKIPNHKKSVKAQLGEHKSQISKIKQPTPNKTKEMDL